MPRSFVLLQRFFVLIILFIAALSATAQTQLTSDVRDKIDKLAAEALAKTGVPSASVAVVTNGQVVYLKAYGDARLDPRTPATAEMRYSIGSISKQFTATAILMLQEQGKLALDDTVARFIPDLTRAKEVTIRQLLSHTSGYQDYWPQDYVMPMMLQPITAQKILDLWARKPLDFDPGTKWQYSNTNYVIAGVIVEKVARMPLLQFLREKVFGPLQMKSVTDTDQEILKPESYRQLSTEVLLKNGLGTHYGLGVDVNSQASRRVLSHGGEVSGFTAQNTVFPDERAAIVVLTNQDAASASGAIAGGIAPLLFATNDPATPAKLEQAKKIFEGLQKGTVDRSLFTENANAYFSEQALKDFAEGLAPLGTPQSFVQTSQGLRGGMTLRVYIIRFPQKVLRAWTYEMPNGKLEQY